MSHRSEERGIDLEPSNHVENRHAEIGPAVTDDEESEVTLETEVEFEAEFVEKIGD